MSKNSQLNAYHQGSSGGTSNIPEPGNPTYTEAWALIECARRMAGAIEFGDPEKLEDRKKIRDAVRLNWRLWTIFQAELTVGENVVVGDQLRTDMLTLCKFVDKQTLAIMAEPDFEMIANLIDINRNIAQGLLASLETGSGEEQSQEDQPEETAEAGSINASA